MSLSDDMCRDLTKRQYRQRFDLVCAGRPAGEAGIRIAIPTGWFFADTISAAERRF